MNKLQRNITSVIAALALVVHMASPVAALASVSCTISGNGSDSSSTCDFATLRDVNVSQSNTMDVENNVDVDATTGDNSASDNTGGEVEITTGDVDVHVETETAGNTNAAAVQGTSTSQDYEMTVSGNGTGSDNNVEVDVTDEVDVEQDNDADVSNTVDVHASTGGNDTDDNTGGDVAISTGAVDVDSIKIMTSVNANSATVGGSAHTGSLMIGIMDNGSDTDNDIDFALLSDLDVDQENDADVDNDVDVDATTGDNGAADNTGGDVMIATGETDVEIMVDTMANFNQADVETSYLGDVELKVKENGTDSDNEIEIDLTDELDVDQDNDLDVDNDDIEVDAATGGNDADDNTVGSDGDPVIETGDTDTGVHVTTSGNANAFGGDLDIEVEFDMSELMNLLHALSSLLNL